MVEYLLGDQNVPLWILEKKSLCMNDFLCYKLHDYDLLIYCDCMVALCMYAYFQAKDKYFQGMLHCTV